MKKAFITIGILFLFFISCKNNNKVRNNIIDSQTTEKIEYISPELKKEVKRYIKETDLKDSSVVYTVQFLKENIFFFTEKDSSIVISCLRCRENYSGYKGIIKIEK